MKENGRWFHVNKVDYKMADSELMLPVVGVEGGGGGGRCCL